MVDVSKHVSVSPFVVLLAIIAALCGVLFGFDTGVVAGAVLFVKQEFHLSTTMVEIVVSVALLGAFIGAFLSGKLADRFGRRNMMMVTALAFILGALGSALATSITLLLWSRLLVGMAVGLASYLAPLYISEIAPSHRRGTLVILNTITVTGGIVVAYLVDLYFSSTQDWRWMFGMGVFPGILLAFGVLFLPQSPRWLMEKGLLSAARRVLLKIRKDQAESEFHEIEQTIAEEKKCHWRELFSKKMKGVLWLGCGLAIIQQVTGINTILYYAPSIFKAAGFHGTTSQLLAGLGVGVTNFIMTIVALWLVDKIGRRPLLLVGLAVMALSLAVVALTFAAHLHGLLLQWSAVLSLVLFVAFYALSIGCLFWLIISEIYPLNMRGRAMSVATACNWIANLAVASTFLTLIDTLGPSLTFSIYAMLSAVSFFLCWRFVPETKGVSLENIEHNLHQGRALREIGAAKKV